MIEHSAERRLSLPTAASMGGSVASLAASTSMLLDLEVRTGSGSVCVGLLYATSHASSTAFEGGKWKVSMTT